MKRLDSFRIGWIHATQKANSTKGVLKATIIDKAVWESSLAISSITYELRNLAKVVIFRTAGPNKFSASEVLRENRGDCCHLIQKYEFLSMAPLLRYTTSSAEQNC